MKTYGETKPPLWQTIIMWVLILTVWGAIGTASVMLFIFLLPVIVPAIAIILGITIVMGLFMRGEQS